ncbi:hypothetical protein [Isoptericola sp. NPDC058082]|uniref:hypothetical protein n=1 Tax=Isoptericola sp. NPDC058082 TaxID=3346331 RepID=UPI0036E4A512
MTSADETQPAAAARPPVLRPLAVVLGISWSVLFFGIIDLTSYFDGPEWVPMSLLATGWGLLFTVLVAVPLVAAGIWPRLGDVAALQLALVGLAIVVAAALSGTPGHLVVALGVLGSAAPLVVPGRRLPPVPRPRVRDWWPGAWAAVGAWAWTGYAGMAVAATWRGLPDDITLGLPHWPVQAALPLGLALVAGLAAVHPAGWVLPTTCVALSAVWLGVASLLRPDVLGSLGAAGGVAAVVWGAGLVVATWVTAPRAGAPRTSVE